MTPDGLYMLKRMRAGRAAWRRRGPSWPRHPDMICEPSWKELIRRHPFNKARDNVLLDSNNNWTGTVRACARCGLDHPELTFKPLTSPCGDFTHWCPCPTNGEPILMSMDDTSVPPLQQNEE